MKSSCDFFPGNGLFPAGEVMPQACCGPAVVQEKRRIMATENLGTIWSNVLMIQIGKLRPRAGKIGHRVGAEPELQPRSPAPMT